MRKTRSRRHRKYTAKKGEKILHRVGVQKSLKLSSTVFFFGHENRKSQFAIFLCSLISEWSVPCVTTPRRAPLAANTWTATPRWTWPATGAAPPPSSATPTWATTAWWWRTSRSGRTTTLPWCSTPHSTSQPAARSPTTGNLPSAWQCWVWWWWPVSLGPAFLSTSLAARGTTRSGWTWKKVHPKRCARNKVESLVMKILVVFEVHIYIWHQLIKYEVYFCNLL